MSSSDPPRELKVFLVSQGDLKQPIKIPIQIEYSDDREPELHEFMAVGDAGAGGMLSMMKLVRWDPKGRQIVDLTAMMSFFERVFMGDDFKRLEELVDRKDVVIPMETLGEIFNGLLEEYTGRPLEPSGPSTTSSRAIGARSTARPRSTRART